MHALLHSVPLSLQQATDNPCLRWRLLDTHGQVWVSFLWGHCSYLLGPSVHKILFVPSKGSVSSVLCKFWWFYGGVNGDLLQEHLCHTQVRWTQSPCPCGRSLLTCTSTGDTQTQFWLILCGLAVPFVPFPCLSSSGDQVLGGTVSDGLCLNHRLLSFLGALGEHCLRCAVCLLWRAHLRLWTSWWMSTIQALRKMWLASGSLLTVWWRMPFLGQDCSSPLPSGWGGASTQPASSPLVSAQSFFLSGPGCALGC